MNALPLRTAKICATIKGLDKPHIKTKRQRVQALAGGEVHTKGDSHD